MSSTAALLDRVVTDLGEAVRAVTGSPSSDAERLDVLRVAGEAQRLLDAVIAETIANTDSAAAGPDGFAARFGCRNLNELLQRVLRVDAHGAARVVKASAVVHREVDITSGEPLPARWPALREAFLEGAVGIAGLLAATGPIEQAGHRIGIVERLRADAELAQHARGHAPDATTDAPQPDAGPAATPEDLRTFAQVIVMYLDPDGAEPAYERAMRHRGLTLGRARDGVIPVRGGLLPEVAGQLQRIWDAYLNPKVEGPPVPGVTFRPSDELDDGGLNEPDDTYEHDGLGDTGIDADGPDEPAGIADLRTRAQQQHDAFAAALGIAARHDDMPTLGGAAPTLVVSVTAEDYATGRGWAHIDGIDTPAPISLAAHTACAGTVQRVLFDPEGRIIGIGVTDRIFTVHQRRAITLRDRECLIPGCHVPASWCEIHHITEHASGGPTHTDNGVALCWHHHRTLPTSGWDIRTHNGIPQIRGPAWWDPTRTWRNPHPAQPHPLRR